MRHLLVLPAFLAFLAFAACGPVPLVQAEAECRTRADQAAAPTGSVGLGMSSDGTVETSLELNITSDYLSGRSPSDVYNQCVMAKSGLPPERPYLTYPHTR